MHPSTIDVARRTFLQAGLVGSASMYLPALAQTGYPSGPIRLVVGAAAGSATDLTARLLADRLAIVFGEKVIVDNKPGAGFITAASFVSQSDPDGLTLLTGGVQVTAINPELFKRLPYDPAKLLPISNITRQPFVVNASPLLPVKDISGLVQYGKKKQEGLSIGVSGTGSIAHIIAEWIGRRLGILLRPIPYPGAPQSLGDLMSGRLDLQINGLTAAAILHRAAKVRLLASLGEDQTGLPEGVETFKQAGYADLVAYTEFGILGVTGTPEPVTRKLFSALQTAASTPEFRRKMEGTGEHLALSDNSAQFAQYLGAERGRWSEIIKPMGLKLDV